MTRAELERALRAVDPHVRLVRSALLRRVIKAHAGVRGVSLGVPHAKGYSLSAAELAPMLEGWGVRLDGDGAERITLLVAPEDEDSARSDASLLRRYWRLLFHQHVHLWLEPVSAEWTVGELRALVERVGQVPFDEVRMVLADEHMLLPPRDDRAILVELAAVWWELAAFDRPMLARWFPTIAESEDVAGLMHDLVPGAELLERTRPEGSDLMPAHDVSSDANGSQEAPARRRAAAGGDPQRLRAAAERARSGGNHVRAAVLSWRAGVAAAGDPAAAAQTDIDVLAAALTKLGGVRGAPTQAWAAALLPLVAEAASVGWRAPARRLLHDLQKVTIVGGRELFVVDLVVWVRSLFRRPLKRQLSGQRLVIVARLFRKARGRLGRSRIAAEDQERLGQLLAGASRAAGQEVREAFRPRIRQALEAEGIRPENLAQSVARDKLTHELLDRLETRDFIRMSDLRDALSRSDMRLPDLRGWRDWVIGDPLLRADKRLMVALDGVYQPGEVYLRGLQRLSALLFGNPVGRFATRYAILPFGGAFVILEGLGHMIALPLKIVGSSAHPQLLTWPSFVVAGVFLLALIHVPSVRRATWEGLKFLGRGLRKVFVDAPRWVLRRPLVQRILRSPITDRVWSYLLLPVAVVAPAWAIATALGLPMGLTAGLGAGLVGLASASLNSRLGLQLRDYAADGLARSSYYVRHRMLPGLYEVVMGVFRDGIELLERGMYAVDEWLHEHQGQSLVAAVVKPLLGVVWWLVTYLVRFYVNLLIEPQVNPIKHFPVVTVSHKMILPFTLEITAVLSTPLQPLGPVAANAIAGTTVVLLPGVFGFLVWEFKENWRVFEANRPGVVQPVLVGSHGETMARLLRLGFHSGTVPKLYRKLRRAERRGHRRSASRHAAGLHHVEESVARFFERELFALLAESGRFEGVGLCVAHVALGSNHIRVELRARAGQSLHVAFEEQSGWLVAWVVAGDLLRALDVEQRDMFETALAGAYARAGVDLVREQVEAQLPGGPTYDVGDGGLVVWPTGGQVAEVVYALRGKGAVLEPTPKGALPALRRDELVFSHHPLAWDVWVKATESGRSPELRSIFRASLVEASRGNQKREEERRALP